MLTNIYIGRIQLGMQDTISATTHFESWIALRDRFLETHHDVFQGKMMSADALTHNGSVFAFYSTKGGRVGLGCRVGRETDIGHFNLSDWQHLAPFKNKPPMKDWIVVGLGDLPMWSVLAEHCLHNSREREQAQ